MLVVGVDWWFGIRLDGVCFDLMLEGYGDEGCSGAAMSLFILPPQGVAFT